MVVTASIGIAVSDGRSDAAEALVRDADVAMYRAKEHGGARYELFDSAMRRRMIERLDLEQDLRRALDRDEFELHYQPLVALDERRIVAVEALVRWRHPQRGLVLPGAFIPVAEESGLIVPLGRWVLREACRQLARWSADPAIDLPCVSVNLSGASSPRPTCPRSSRAPARDRRPPERLALELTESVLMEETYSPTAVLQGLKALGVRLMLDDFGTGYSSLNYVKRFPIEAIKVDRSFFAGVVEDESDRHILRAIVSMATAMDVEVVAEGVESARAGALAAPPRDRARPGLRVRAPGARLGDRDAAARRAAARSPRARLRAAERRARGRPGRAARPDRAGPAAAAGGATVTLGEAAEALGVSTSTLRRWADTGRIQVVRTSGGHRRFPASELRRLNAESATRAARCARSRCPPRRSPPCTSCSAAPPASSPPPSRAASTTVPPRAGSPPPPGREQLARGRPRSPRRAAPPTTTRALEATRRLVTHADLAGATLLERHTFLERFGDAAVRTLQERGVDRAPSSSAPAGCSSACARSRSRRPTRAASAARAAAGAGSPPPRALTFACR